MSRLLRIDASSRADGSHSRALGDYFEGRWREQNPSAPVVRRDLAKEPVAHITETTIAGFFTPPEQMSDESRTATACSDRLIGELQDAEELLITTPMYNFTVPSSLKGWIDQIVRIGHTFSFDGQAFKGLVPVERAYVLCAYGANGYLEGGALGAANFLQPYLAFLLGFLGIGDVRFISIEGTNVDEAMLNSGMNSARAEIDAIFGKPRKD